jgi:hypothetical protein
MATGQVGFKDNKLVKKVLVETRENAIVNRLNKTKVERFPDLKQEKAERDGEEQKKERIAAQEKVCLGGSMGGLVLTLTDCWNRRKKTHELRRSERGSSMRRNICTTTCTRRRI